MRRVSILSVVVAILLVGVTGFALSDSPFQVLPQQQAIVLRGGAPARLVQPGLHLKVPFVEQLYDCDITVIGRIEQSGFEATDADRTPIVIDASLSYRIDDCLRFYATTRDPHRLDQLIGEAFDAALRESGARAEEVERRVQAFAENAGAVVIEVKIGKNSARDTCRVRRCQAIGVPLRPDLAIDGCRGRLNATSAKCRKVEI